MDIAYDRIQEEALSPDEIAEREKAEKKESQQTLNTEFAQAYKAFSSSPWGAKFEAFVGNVKKQGETYYEEARQEYNSASTQASKGLNDILNRTRSLSLGNAEEGESSKDPDQSNAEKAGDTSKDSDAETLPSAEGVLSRFRSEAAKRLKDIEKAEDAADEALLKFGTNIRNFLREAVTIAPPEEGDEALKDGKGRVLFESKDSEGKRVIHSTRLGAQLHVIHSSLDSFLKDPASPEYEPWSKGFSVESKTDDIAQDLEKHKQLRTSMETLVPDRVKYEIFWTRYYFLRHVVETEEQRRKDLLKGVGTEDEEVAWDEESEASAPPSPKPVTSDTTKKPTDSTTTLQATAGQQPHSSAQNNSDSAASLKPSDSRKSNDQHSQPDSDASYDVVSGAPSAAASHGPSSPKREGKQQEGEVSDEDWE